MESSRREAPYHHRCSHVFLLVPAILWLILVSHLIILQTAGQLLHLPPLDHHELATTTGDDHDHIMEEYYDCSCRDDDIPRLYIVHLLPPRQHRMLMSSPEELEAWYRSFLPSSTLLMLDSSGKPDRLVHSYTKAICGFAAWLTPREVEAMREMEGFVDARPDEPLELATSHTPKFLQLENGTGLWQQTRWGDRMHIGVVDFNFDPDHVSFAGEGMQPSTTTCHCTNKLLGAARDGMPRGVEDSHGTIVASIAAGDFRGDVTDFSFPGYARGTASGVSPKSYLSLYNGKSTAGFVAAIERAIADGVNVVSVSMIIRIADYPYNDMAVATLAAVENGIVVVMAAGNDGPAVGTIQNNAPWLLTVGASTHDRAPEMEFTLTDVFRRAYSFNGVTQYQLSETPNYDLPLVYPGEGRNSRLIRACHNTLGGQDVTGAMVLCWRDPAAPPADQAETVKNAGGRVMVLMNDGTTWGDDLGVVPYLHIPTVVMKHSDSNTIIQRYVSSKQMGPVLARVRAVGSRFNTRPCPVVYDSSSRGPNTVSESILKPDIVAPGVNILGAKEGGSEDRFRTGTGTSLATPHVAGVAALLKSRHPGWSPAGIRSAIMTTANITDTDGNRITDHTGVTASFYAVGAGLVNPERADDPGLVYDITDPADYMRVLCGLYRQDQVNLFARRGRIVDCTILGTLQPEELNYPSIAMTLLRRGKKVVHRTVTNVGPAMSEYTYLVEDVPMGEVRVSVTPRRLAFTRRGEQLDFTVEAELVPGPALPSGKVIEGYLKWTSVRGRRVVRSPLALIVP